LPVTERAIQIAVIKRLEEENEWRGTNVRSFPSIRDLGAHGVDHLAYRAIADERPAVDTPESTVIAVI
jgi:hypothetical protein